MKKAFRAAFLSTIPILLGYVFVGTAFGLLFVSAGYAFYWALLMSCVIYAGSMQFVALNFFTNPFGLAEIAVITLLVNARHIFYGLSFTEKFKKMKGRPYLVFSLTDETYSLFCSVKPPSDVNENYYMFFTAILNQSYWITGTLIGGLLGNRIPFDATGIEFAMTALFIVIFVEQWINSKSKIPALIGIFAPLILLPVFGADNLVLAAMGLIALSLIVFKSPIEKSLSVGENQKICFIKD